MGEVMVKADPDDRNLGVFLNLPRLAILLLNLHYFYHCLVAYIL